MRSQLASVDVGGKPLKSWTVKDLMDAFEHDFNFTHEGHKFTLRRKLDEEGEETDSLDLDIDGLVFQMHPFVSSDFVLDEDKQLVLSLGLKINGKEIFQHGESETWSSAMLN